MKWSRAEPFLMKYSLDGAVRKAIEEQAPKHLSNLQPVSIADVKTRRGNAIRIFYKGKLPEDAVEYEINRTVMHYAYIYEEDDPTTYKAIKKALKEAGKDA